jgi:hypothetical protein
MTGVYSRETREAIAPTSLRKTLSLATDFTAYHGTGFKNQCQSVKIRG